MNHKPAAPRQILVIEDEPDIAALLVLHLGELPARVEAVAEGRWGLQRALAQPWDALILDLRLPGLSGLDICREIRQQGLTVPVLMLTARSSELDRVLGLELGADDYLVKPFSVLELQARVRALWRRMSAQAHQVRGDDDAALELQIGTLRISKTQRRAFAEQQELALTVREFDLLWFFASNPGRAFSRAELLDKVWGYRHDGYDHTVNTHINRLRGKLGDDYIQTVWGVGYRFEVPA